MASINDLPEEILEYILCLVSPYSDLRSCRQVCQRWYFCCQGVVDKTKNRFISSLKLGCIEWYTPKYPSHIIPIGRRYSHSAAVYESSMYIFGGCTATNTTFNDLWRFDLGTHEWTRLLTTGTYPSPKAYASMIVSENFLILFGGWTHPSLYPLHQQWVLFNELHVYDIPGNRWTQLYYPGAPPPTAAHSVSVQGDVMVMFGGLQKQEGTSSGTNDVFCLDIKQQCWFKPVVSEPMPMPRYGHSQIKLDDHHILILAGCGGSNKLYNDIWLLTLPENICDRNAKWNWEQITIDNSGGDVPSQNLMYNPACKVGKYVVVMSTFKSAGNKGCGGSMSQLLVPSSVRRQPPNVWVPPMQQPEERPQDIPIERRLHEHMVRQRMPYQLDVLPVEQAGESSSDENEEGQFQGAFEDRGARGRGRPRPSIRPNASCDRQKRLQVLSRMKERIRELSRQQEMERHQERQRNDRLNVEKSVSANPRSTVTPHLLDISQVLAHKKAKWLPISNYEGIPTGIGTPPQSSLLYSLVLGRGHLVIFGGIPHDPTGQSNETVSNTVTFISSPSSLYFTS